MKKEGEKKFSNRGRGRTSCLNLSLADCSSLDYEYEAKHSYCVLYAEHLTSCRTTTSLLVQWVQHFSICDCLQKNHAQCGLHKKK